MGQAIPEEQKLSPEQLHAMNVSMGAALQIANADYARFIPPGKLLNYRFRITPAFKDIRDNSTITVTYEQKFIARTMEYFHRQHIILNNPAKNGLPTTMPTEDATEVLPITRQITLSYRHGKFHAVEWRITRDNNKPIPSSKQTKHYFP